MSRSSDMDIDRQNEEMHERLKGYGRVNISLPVELLVLMRRHRFSNLSAVCKRAIIKELELDTCKECGSLKGDKE